jgi:hypothetical protein
MRAFDIPADPNLRESAWTISFIPHEGTKDVCLLSLICRLHLDFRALRTISLSKNDRPVLVSVSEYIDYPCSNGAISERMVAEEEALLPNPAISFYCIPPIWFHKKATYISGSKE